MSITSRSGQRVVVVRLTPSTSSTDWSSAKPLTLAAVWTTTCGDRRAARRPPCRCRRPCPSRRSRRRRARVGRGDRRVDRRGVGVRRGRARRRRRRARAVSPHRSRARSGLRPRSPRPSAAGRRGPRRRRPRRGPRSTTPGSSSSTPAPSRTPPSPIGRRRPRRRGAAGAQRVEVARDRRVRTGGHVSASSIASNSRR